MPAIAVKPGIYWVGVNDRTTDLFEGIWPIAPRGVSYNSYLVVGEKTALIDLASGSQQLAYLQQIRDVLDPAELDYVIINHMEPDHTSAVRLLHQLAAKAQFLLTAKALPLMEAFYGITERVRVVGDGESLPLGGKTLQFHAAPFVHWPETMVTYETTTGVLFACDAFGGYGALTGGIFDDEYADKGAYIEEALRYYVNIVARFSAPVLKAIDKLGGLDISVVAPSHGLVWRENPAQIIQLYKRWAELATQPGEPGVTLIYGSMYGNTEVMMNAVAQGIARTGLPLQIFDAARTHSSYILPAAWRYSGVMVGAPTYEVSLFPPVAQALEAVAHKRIMNRKAAYFGSYGWSGGAHRECQAISEKLKWDWCGALEFVGAPTTEQLGQGADFGEAFARSLLHAPVAGGA
jgi:flavorubredoxin